MAGMDFSSQAEPLDFSASATAMDISPQENPEKKRTWADTMQTAARQLNQGMTFGFADELTDPLAVSMSALVTDPKALITGELSDPAMIEEAVNARQNTQNDLNRDWKEAPILSAGTNIAGGVLTAGGASGLLKAASPTAAGIVANAAKQFPKTAAFITGAGSGGLYSAGQGEGSIAERAPDFGTGAAWGGPLGVGGYLVAKGIGNAGSALAEKYGPVVAPYFKGVQDAVSPIFTGAKRSAGILDDVAGSADDMIKAADDITPMKMAGILDEQDLANLDRGRTIPMTKGDRTQNVATQRMEQMAEEAGSAPMIAARAEQRQAARKPFLNVLGADVSQDALDLNAIEQGQAEKAANLVRSQYDDLGKRVSAAYKAAEQEGRGVAIAGNTVSDDLIGSIDNMLFDEAYRKGDIPALDKHIDDLKNIIGDNSMPNPDVSLDLWFRGSPDANLGNQKYNWFTKNPDVASKYAINHPNYAPENPTPAVFPAKLRDFKNPASGAEYIKRLRDLKDSTSALDSLKNDGFDGLIMDKGTENEVRVAFSQSDITTSFSRKIPDALKSPASIKALEDWKKRLNATIGNTPMDQKDTLRKLKMVGRQYDSFLTNVADDAIINGDDAAIKAFKEARSLAKQKFDFYESDKGIQRILDTRDLTGEQLVNIVMGAEKLTGKGDNGQLVNRMISLAGDNAPEMKDALKKGIMAKTFRRGLIKNTADPVSPEQSMVSFAKMRSEVGNLLSKKEMLSAIFDDTEQQYLRQFYDDLKLVASKQKGAVNNSSTGIWTAEFAKGLGRILNNPLIRSNPLTGVPGKVIDEQFQKYAAQQITGKAEKGLSEFIEQQINSINPPAAYYGSIGANSVGADRIWNDLILNKEEQ